MARWIGRICVGSLGLLALPGCKDDTPSGVGAGAASASADPSALTPEQASRVLAKVGDRTITLGEFAETLARMDQFERLRYQTPERRRELLQEMIDMELLAREAERRGLHELPETREHVRQLLREELLRRARADVPALDALPESEVAAYYDKHREDFREPERRRVAHIVMSDQKQATEVLGRARTATPIEWGELVGRYSLDVPKAKGDKTTARPPLELSGDLGMVSAPGSDRGGNDRVPEPVRSAVFTIEDLGGVHPVLVEHAGRFHIVRLAGKSAARDRSRSEADRTIRVRLLQERIAAAEAKLERELRAKIPVQIDREALASVEVPAEAAVAPSASARLRPAAPRPSASR